MNELRSFHFDGAPMHVVDEAGTPWFLAKDVASILGYADTDQAIRRHCRHAKRMTPLDRRGQRGGAQFHTIIPEPDLYRLVVRSKLPSAQRFEAWVFDEVLPALRRDGSYGGPSVSTDQIAQAAIAVLPALVEQAVEARLASDARIAVAANKSVRELLDDEKVPSRGRRGLIVRCSAHFRAWCFSEGVTPLRCARTGTWLFPIAAAERWMREHGRFLVAAHMDRISGQLRLHLVEDADR